MAEALHSCHTCGGKLGVWSFEVCAECLLRAGLENVVPADDATETPRLGGYRMIEWLGSGRMGTVYIAEQDEPRRLVAIKVIRDNFDGDRIFQRFRYELEALSTMEHPGIARVYDAQRLADGRPYFVTEFVDGQPLTSFAIRHQLPHGARIDLFLEVCDAIHHSHQRGVIHRDLKPSNVLVAIENGRPVPKVIDFGVFRAIGNQRTSSSLADDIVGTPAYMSPEQTIPGAPGDTRSDVYGLGVVLYELLTGGVPDPMLAGWELPVSLAAERIRHVNPIPPSVRGNTRTLRGDLDAIILKAIAKEPSRRYGSVEGLADDLRRHLRGEPVLARAPSFLYRASRFASRHRWAVATGVALLLMVGALLAMQLAKKP